MNHWRPQRTPLTCALLISLIGCLLGCGQSKESLHEMDHVTPAHWPNTLEDAAAKIRERLAATQSIDKPNDNNVAFEELSDLIGWVPEIAADTDLQEAEWNKLYEASEVARKALQRTKAVDAELAKNIEVLCERLVAAHKLLPQPSSDVDPELPPEELTTENN